MTPVLTGSLSDFSFIFGKNNWQTLHEGGRLSKKVITDNAEKINKFFGCEVAHLINTKKTLIIKEYSDSGLGSDNPHSHAGEQ